MDEKELAGLKPGERVKTLHVVCDGSFVHPVILFGENDTETSRTYLRPRWLKVDSHRAHTTMSQSCGLCWKSEGATGLSVTSCPAV